MKSILLTLMLSAGFVLAESSIPDPYPKERYTGTLSQSPFVLATRPENPAPPGPGPLDNIVVTGIGRLDDGRAYVVVQRLGDERSMTFIGSEPNEKGIWVKEVKWADRWPNSSLIMKCGSVEKVVKFNEKTVPLKAPVPPKNNGPKPVPKRPQ
jgi:hypothetical protein